MGGSQGFRVFALPCTAIPEVLCDDLPLNGRHCSADDVWSADFTGDISRYLGEV